ncbi:protein MEI2-like 5 [Camellia sinensis]|uniref:protein MEI2-like 5 n=1 Tax=Camellia sinensis TaxID=4442 RepID=UPI0010358D36|nr:protein MEI2-like 5 [Camellia sinensis]
MLQPTSKTTVEICRAFDTVRDCCKDDLAEQTYFRLKAQKADFIQDGSDPYVQESSFANSSTSFPGPVSVGIIPLQGDFENEETSSCMEEYQIDITRIMQVEDNRTTVMIHNIPKRYVKFN